VARGPAAACSVTVTLLILTSPKGLHMTGAQVVCVVPWLRSLLGVQCCAAGAMWERGEHCGGGGNNV